MKRYLAAAATLSLVAALLAGQPAQADNPIITSVYTADPAPLVVGDTMYVYTGRDEAAAGQSNFVMREWRVLSTTDAENWTDHGARLSLNDFTWASADAWAAEVEYRNGQYYWYTSINGDSPGWMNIGVAVGNSPLGPFTDAKGGPLISDSTPNSSGLNIDPTVFIDDDGQAYMYWGSYWGARAVRLADNMIDLEGEVVTPQGLADFWEAPFMFKRNGIYYMIYAANDTNGCVTDSAYACQRYATASNPLGPWTHRGIVLDRVSSTTNHAGAVEFNGQWYLVYHTADAPGGGNFRRSVAVDKLYFNADGTMQKVIQTVGPPPPPPPPGDNLALSASPVCSYTSSWESCAAINDGINPPSSNDTVNPRWGTWPETGEQSAELQWGSAQTVNRAEVYFFDDDQGIDLPASWTLQYWNGSAYVNVPGASGYPVAANQYNTVTFGEACEPNPDLCTSVNTTRLRVLLQSSGSDSVGLLEIGAYGDDDPPPPPPPPDENLALTASASCSYTSPWEACSAVNNGDEPTSSNYGAPDEENRWGTWPEEGQQWAELTWSSAQDLSRAEVYFFDDNQGIDLPASWTLQYWNGSSYVNVPGASGYPVAANQYNEVTFGEACEPNPDPCTSVNTTRLRVLLQSATDFSVGLLEIKAFS